MPNILVFVFKKHLFGLAIVCTMTFRGCAVHCGGALGSDVPPIKTLVLTSGIFITRKIKHVSVSVVLYTCLVTS